MHHRFTVESVYRGSLPVLTSVLLFSTGLRAESYPRFDQQYWEDEFGKAHGKIMRGAVLGATGLVTAAPTAVLAIKAADNPEQYLAYSVAVGIAALGMTFHGFFSIGFGARQRDQSSVFLNLYRKNPAGVDAVKERDYYLRTKKKSTGKMVLFGLVLDVQAAVLLANGIVLSVRRNDGGLSEDIKIWPSYLIGGLLLAGGTAFAVLRGRRYRALSDLGRQPAPVSDISFAPLIGVSPTDGSVYGGLLGGLTF